MRWGNPYRADANALGPWLLQTFDNLWAAITGAWNIEHKDDDRHGHVHADTLQVGRVSYSNIYTPQPFAQTPINNFNDSALRDAGLLRLSVTGLTEASLTGIQVPLDENGKVLDGRVLVIENTDGSAIIALENDDTRSSPANRFSIPYNPESVTGASNRYFLHPRTLTTIIYSSVLARWLVHARTHEEVLSYAEFGSSQNDYAPANFRAARVVRLIATAANLTISGFSNSGISKPHRKTIINEGTFRFAILHMNTGSSANNRVQCPGGTMYYVNPRESVDLYYETDGTWHIILKADQYIDVAHAAGNFTADSGTWTVDSGDQITYCYQIDGNKMHIAFLIINSDVSAAVAGLKIAIPAGRVVARTTFNAMGYRDAGTQGSGFVRASAGATVLRLVKNIGETVNWTVTAADDTDVTGEITFMVETSCATVSEPHQDTAHGDTGHADGGHSDVAHVDVAHDDTHSDVTHTDSAHGDVVHSDTHGDVAHSDVVHDDDAHVDTHDDGAHSDTHSDTAHSDTEHVDAHTDNNQHDDFNDGFHFDHDDHSDTHADTAHGDTEHADSHGDASHADAHGDEAHDDVAHGDSHTDTHTDVAHVDTGHTDVAHQDTHTDAPHSDVAHTDSAHTDTAHVDTPHVDVGLHCDTAHSDI